MAKRLGLIIGVNQYQDPTFRPLQFAENDARALAQWLVNAQGGKWNPSDVQLVQGMHATRELTESLIMQVCLNVAEPGDLVMIYFAGHAFIDEGSGQGFLALANTRYQEARTGLHLLSFAQHILTRSRAGHILLILDCFQNGPAWRTQRVSPFDARPVLGPVLNIIQQQSNRLVLCSCRGNDLIPEAGERGLGLFIHRTIVGLCGPASDPATGNISLQSLQQFLSKSLADQQRPQLFGQEQSPLVLVGDMPFPLNAPSSQGTQQMPPGAPTPFMADSGTPGFNTSNSMPPGAGPERQQVTTGAHYATMTAQRDTSAYIPQSAVDQQLLQQSKLMLGQAQQLLQAENYPEAFGIVERILQVIPNDSAAWLLKAQILGTAGRQQESLAVVEQFLQIDSHNALAWSMRAVLLSNMGQHEAAQAAIERSLEIDASNPESYGIKNTIMANIAATQHAQSSRLTAPSSQAGRAGAFFLALLLQFLGLGLGVAGTALSIFQPGLKLVALALFSLGLTMLCASAARVTYRYGFAHLLPTFLVSLLAGGALVAIEGPLLLTGLASHLNPLAPLAAKLSSTLATHFSWMAPVAFLGVWLAVAATLPLLLALGGAFAGIGARKRKR